MEFEELKKKSKAAKTENQIEQKVEAKDIGKESKSGDEENKGNTKKCNANENVVTQKKKRKKQKKENDNEDVPEKMKKVELEFETGVDSTGKNEKDLEETVSKEIT